MILLNRFYCILSLGLINLLPILCAMHYGWVIYMLLQPIAIMISATLYKCAENVERTLKRLTKVIIVAYCSAHMLLMIAYVVHPALAHNLY